MQVANKHTKMLLTSLIIGKVQLKTALRQAEWPSLKKIYKQQMLESMWRKWSPLAVCGKVNGYSHYEEQHGNSFKNWEEIYRIIPLLGTYSENATILKDTVTPVFISALLILEHHSDIKMNKFELFISWTVVSMIYRRYKNC